LLTHSDAFKHSRGIDSLHVSSPTRQITACDELGEILTVSSDGKISKGASKTRLGPGARIFGHDAEGNLVIAAQKQLVRFKADGTPRDGVQFKEDCVDFGIAGEAETSMPSILCSNAARFKAVRRFQVCTGPMRLRWL
jgi:hypothetical protein